MISEKVLFTSVRTRPNFDALYYGKGCVTFVVVVFSTNYAFAWWLTYFQVYRVNVVILYMRVSMRATLHGLQFYGFSMVDLLAI